MKEYIVTLDFDIPMDTCLKQQFLDECLVVFVNGRERICFGSLTEGNASLNIHLERLYDELTKHKEQASFLENPSLNIGVFFSTYTCQVRMQGATLKKFFTKLPELAVSLTYYPIIDDDEEQA